MKSLLTLFLFILVACSSTQKKVDLYPRQEIDRPYSLSDGLKAWNTTAYFLAGAFLINPLFWEQSLSDNFSLLWTPLPLGFRWQILRKGNHRLGFTAASYLFLTDLQLDSRYILSRNWALDGSVEYSATQFFGLFSSDSTTLSLGPLWQATSELAFQPSVNQVSGSASSGFLESTFNAPPGSSRTTYTGVGAGFKVYYNFAKQWNLKASVSTLSAKTSFLSGSYSTGSLTLTHLWD